MKLLRVMVSVAVLLSCLAFQPAGNAGSFKLKKVGEHKFVSKDDSKYVISDLTVIELATSNQKSSRLYATGLRNNKRIWEREIKHPYCTFFLAHDGKLFIDNIPRLPHFDSFTSKTLSVDNDDGGNSFMYCINLKTGKQEWELRNISDSPVLIKNNMYLVRYFTSSIFSCISTSTKTTLWTKKPPIEGYLFNCFVDKHFRQKGFNHAGQRLGEGNDDLIFLYSVSGGGPGLRIVYALYCVDAKTGKTAWQDSVNQHHQHEQDIQWISDKENIYLKKTPRNSNDGTTATLTCRNIKTGATKWHTSIQDDDNYDSYFDCSAKYIVSNNTVLDIKTGALIKRFPEKTNIRPSKELNQAYLFNSNGIEAVMALTGKRIWHKTIQLSEKYFPSAVVLESLILEKDNKLFVLTDQGLTCIDAQTGKTLDSWNYKVTPKSVTSAGKNLVACEIINTENNPTVLLFEY